MNQINLLPWREKKRKLEEKKFFTLWLGILCSFVILLFAVKIIIIHQIKHYQLASDQILSRIKITSLKVQQMKRLQQEEQELKEIIKETEINHRQIRKLLAFISYLNSLVSPDIFVRLIEFHPPYLNLIMRADSERRCSTFVKVLQLKYDSKLQWLILNKFQGLHLDFIIKMIWNEK